MILYCLDLAGFWAVFIIFCKDYASTCVLIACIIAAVRRGLFKPERYAVPEKYGKAHTFEAVFVLGIISILMISESLFEASETAYELSYAGNEHFFSSVVLSLDI